jgi:hypothetical protein
MKLLYVLKVYQPVPARPAVFLFKFPSTQLVAFSYQHRLVMRLMSSLAFLVFYKNSL